MHQTIDIKGQTKTYKTPLGKNIEKFKDECGWSYDELAEKSKIDKALILGHVNKGKGAHPSTKKKYADAFTKKLGRPITPLDLVD